MDKTAVPLRQRDKAKVQTLAAVAAAAAGVAIGLAFAPHQADSTKIVLPPQVSGRNCYAVARDAHLLKRKITGESLGTYYVAWVKKFAGGSTHVTRESLFHAGLAVSVCLK